MHVLGIDPGSRRCGWGVVALVGVRVVHVAHGVVRLDGDAPPAVRLAALHAALGTVIAAHRPARAAVERVFVAGNPASALKLGQSRGVALAALAAAGLIPDEVAPTVVKKAVTGTGRAAKGQMQAMVAALLGLDKPPAQDAADALAVAVAGAARAGALTAAVVDTPGATGKRPSARAARDAWAAVLGARATA